ncbi:MAG: hypothetical protein HFJ02_02370 [Bacilli bacterium]|nr:hypothetical protein [Bacilli bacterium]
MKEIINQVAIDELKAQLSHSSLTPQKRKKLLCKIKKLLFLITINESIGLISDTHIGSKDENFEYIKKTYDFFYQKGISKVLHTGDLFDGLCEHQNIYEKSKKNAICQSQLDHLLKEYPGGFENFIILGNHDEDFLRLNDSILDSLFLDREDFIYLGTNVGYLKWYDKTIVMKHQNEDAFASDLILKGHAHFFSYPEFKKTLRLPSLSDNHPGKIQNRNQLPGFIICENENNNYFFDYYIFQEGLMKRVLKQQFLFH